jgi:hypothetical protein
MKSIFRTPALTASSLVIAVCLIAATGVRQQAAQTGQLPFPILPVIAEYEYAPVYFTQWIDDDPQYSSITAILSKSEPPVYKLMLEEKGTGRKVYYCNSEAKVKALRHEGREAYLSAIDYKVIQNVGQQPSYGFGFRDKHGQAVLWRFVPASRPSELGAGLTPIPNAPGLRLDYRDIGTLAGAGTAVQIGDRVSDAAPWPEISHPPYFIAHRGSFTLGRHIGALLTGSERWRVISSPGELREGAQWTLVNERGLEMTWRIRSRRQDELTVGKVVAEGSDSGGMTLNIRATTGGFALRSLLLTSGPQAMRLTFNPELNLEPNAATRNPAEIAFQIDQGEHQKVAQGSVLVEKQENVIRLRWQHKSPEWAKSRPLNTTIKVDPTSYLIEVSQPAR